MKHTLLFSIGGSLLILLLFLAACDEMTPSSDFDSVSLESLSITPNLIRFDSTSPLGEQSVPVELKLFLTGPTDSELQYTVERRGLLVENGAFNRQTDTEYTADLTLILNTGNSRNYTVYAFATEGFGGERIQGGISVKGRTVSPPVIEDAYNTEEVTIPDTGNERVDFYAQVVHPDNQEFIDRVNFILIDQQGSQLGGDFEMFDDGVFNESEGFIDEEGGDNIYSRAFFINPNNNPDTYSVYYFAIGVDGQSSDTLQTQLKIVE